MIDNYYNKKLLDIVEEMNQIFLQGQELSEKAKMLIQRQESLMVRNEEAYDKLRRYQIMFYDYTTWKSREKYFEIMNSFLNNKIDGKNFCRKIQALRGQNMNEAKEIEANLKSKTDFHLTSQSIDFSDITESFNSLIDLFDPNLDDSESNEYAISENRLRFSIKELIIPEFSKYYDFKSSEDSN